MPAKRTVIERRPVSTREDPRIAEVYARYTNTRDRAFAARLRRFITEAEFCELMAVAEAVRNASLAILRQKVSTP